jgi:urea transporter
LGSSGLLDTFEVEREVATFSWLFCEEGNVHMTTITVNESQTLSTPVNFARVIFRGIGQVMFQDNAATGLLFLAGIAIASPLMAIGAAIGAVIGPVTATLAGFDHDEIQAGIYGFNPVLLGTASLFYLQPRILTWVFVVFGSIVASFVTYLMRRYLSFPTYTAPFVVVTWTLIIVAHSIAGTAIDVIPGPVSEVPVRFITQVLRGTAEVMFGANVVSGLLFIVGIAVSNRRHAMLALLGSMLGTILGIYHGNPVPAIDLGIYGYNASLAAIAVYLWRRSLLVSLLAAAITIPITEYFPSAQLGIPALTAPFVLASWAVLLIGKIEVVFMKEQKAV